MYNEPMKPNAISPNCNIWIVPVLTSAAEAPCDSMPKSANASSSNSSARSWRATAGQAMRPAQEKNNKKKEALREEEERIKKAANTEVYADIKNMMIDMEKNRQKKDSLGKAATQINKTQSRTGDQNKIQVPVYNTDQAKRLAAIKKEKDAIEEMTQQETLMLQQMMEKKSQLESMISNMMKAQGDTQNAISNNLKASWWFGIVENCFDDTLLIKYFA